MGSSMTNVNKSSSCNDILSNATIIHNKGTEDDRCYEVNNATINSGAIEFITVWLSKTMQIKQSCSNHKETELKS